MKRGDTSIGSRAADQNRGDKQCDETHRRTLFAPLSGVEPAIKTEEINIGNT
jgi:hypothetical protein